LIALSLGLALLWSLGYRTLGQVLLAKIWSSVGAYLAIMVAYHLLINSLERWHRRTDAEDEAAQLVFRSVKNLLVYGTTLATFMIVLNLLGLLGPLEQIMSFPVFELGKSGVTMWVFIKAALIVVFFVFLSRFSQAYLDYRIYPAVGIEPGLGYALNTFLKYLLLAIGFLVALNVVGLDLRFLLVFAGAIGIGIGMGLQTFAANLISGFTLIFGGKLRKGDWIQVSGTTGVVTDIFLRATQVRDRSGVEYLIPNTELVNGTLVNYSLGSPLICITIPVGVSYNANPRQVESILLAVAKAEPTVSKEKPAAVRFDALADNSINFNLLVWINVKTTPERLVRSALYFAIFEELGKAGIEIPFPQRDVHIRSLPPGLQGPKPA
jgi:small-conductance mechanosensitive channel